MGEEKKRLITETIKNLEQLDVASLRIMKSNAEILKARDALEADCRKAG